MSVTVLDVNIVLYGYLRYHSIMMIPDVIADLISLFCFGSNNIPSKIFEYKQKYNIDGITNNYTNIINLVVNYKSLFFISNDNSLYVKGDNSVGQLGIYLDSNDIRKHEYFSTTKRVQFISTCIGAYHNFVYTINNELYAFGEYDYEQLGLKLDALSGKLETVFGFTFKPIHIEYPFDTALTQIACGQNHSVFLTLNGNVYGCGDAGAFGGIKPNIIGHSFSIFKIERLSNIKLIACAASVSYCVDKYGILYEFGYICNHHNFKRIKNINVAAINCGALHVCLVTNTFEIYTFGGNNLCQCGVGSESEYFNPILKPTNINLSLVDPIPIQISCGNNHTIIKSFKDNFYSFGNNSNNQCLFDTFGAKIFRPTKIPLNSIAKSMNIDKPIINLIPGYDTTYIFQSLK